MNITEAVPDEFETWMLGHGRLGGQHHLLGLTIVLALRA